MWIIQEFTTELNPKCSLDRYLPCYIKRCPITTHYSGIQWEVPFFRKIHYSCSFPENEKQTKKLQLHNIIWNNCKLELKYRIQEKESDDRSILKKKNLCSRCLLFLEQSHSSCATMIFPLLYFFTSFFHNQFFHLAFHCWYQRIACSSFMNVVSKQVKTVNTLM